MTSLNSQRMVSQGHTKMGVSGFSLVELLVVIAVIAVIAAIAIPSISGVVAAANDAKNRQNAQTIAATFVAARAAGMTNSVANENAAVTLIRNGVNVADWIRFQFFSSSLNDNSRGNGRTDVSALHWSNDKRNIALHGHDQLNAGMADFPR